MWAVESMTLIGCISKAVTLEEALEKFHESEFVWLETLKERGNAIPERPKQNLYEAQSGIEGD